MMPQLKKTMPKQQGFSLIEAIVAFLILSIGMLGIASLQMLSLKAGHTAELRTLAVIKAEEMFERIRNNPIALDPANTASASYVATTTDVGTDYACDDSGGTVNLCTYAEMAQYDIFQWKTDLRNSLPDNDNTNASITVVPVTAGNPAATVTITINWQERKQEAQTMDTINYSVTAHICDNTLC
ncbi:MAG: type IV pilus modification protein PilV [Gammaproteobacteria bacterium]|jgi:type IV pilus assembly protein PilV|nr:type IV pilus modification protein PilV [Gammaproteobacteria bacterium]